MSINARAIRDVFVDGLRKRIPALKNHSGALTQCDYVERGLVDAVAVEAEVPLVSHSWNEIVEPLDRAQKRRFAATRRANKRGYRVWLHCHRYSVECLIFPVPEGEASCLDGANRARFERGRGDGCHPNLPVMYDSVRGSRGAVNRLVVEANSIISPASRNAVRSEMRAACCMLCVTITTLTVSRR